MALRKSRNFFLKTTIVFFVVACGNSGSDGGTSSACSSQFVSDYNRIAIAIIPLNPRFSTAGDAQAVINMANQFKSKYSGVVCQGTIQKADSLDPVPTTINANSKMDEIIQTLRQAFGL